VFPQGIMATLPPMGATRETLGFLLDDLSGLLTDLDALFAEHRFLGGAEPTVADLAFYGQLNQIRRDPTGRVMVGDPGRAHGRWLADLERRADGAAAEHAGEAAPDGEALAPLARRIARTYLRFAVANAKALEEAPKGPLAVELAGGVPFQAARACCAVMDRGFRARAARGLGAAPPGARSRHRFQGGAGEVSFRRAPSSRLGTRSDECPSPACSRRADDRRAARTRGRIAQRG